MKNIRCLVICINLLVVLFETAETNLSPRSLAEILTKMHLRLNPTALKNEVTEANKKLIEKNPDYSNGYLSVGNQYSIALKLTKEECDKGEINTQNFDNHVFETARKVMAERNVFISSNVIAAIPRPVINRSNFVEHAEYLVLNHLMESVNSNMCVIVYSHYSPCTGKCLNESNRFNIYPLLDNVFKYIDDGYKAFVFESLFQKDLQYSTKQQVFELLSKPHVKIYCCYYNRNDKIRCSEFDKQNVNQNCLAQLND